MYVHNTAGNIYVHVYIDIYENRINMRNLVNLL